MWLPTPNSVIDMPKYKHYIFPRFYNPFWHRIFFSFSIYLLFIFFNIIRNNWQCFTAPKISKTTHLSFCLLRCTKEIVITSLCWSLISNSRKIILNNVKIYKRKCTKSLKIGDRNTEPWKSSKFKQIINYKYNTCFELD